MTRNPDHQAHVARAPGWRRTLLLCLGIVLVGAAITTVVFISEPTAQRSGATRETPMLVDVVEVERSSYRPTIVAMGSVEAAQDIVLRPRVGGLIVERAPEFTPGGYLAAGQTVLRIDPADFENVLEQRRSDLSQAVTDLELEIGRQNVAQLDYELLGEELAAANESLVLRVPQLEAARSRVAAAEAAVRQAELDLERAGVTAPFAAQVLSREVNLGSQVDVGDALGRLVGLDTYWVVATVPRERLRWIAIPDDTGRRGAAVEVHDPAAWADDETREGYVYSHIAALDEQTRLARVVVAVDDPLGRRPENEGQPELMIGAYVETRIEGLEISDVIRLDRDLVRQEDTVWVMEGDTLSIRDVDIRVRDDQYAYVESGLESGELVVTTNLTTVSDGAALRLTPGVEPDSTSDGSDR